MRMLLDARRRAQPPLPQSVQDMWDSLQRAEFDHLRYASMDENSELLVHDLVGPPGRRSLVICFRSVMLWLQGVVDTTFVDATFDITPVMEVRAYIIYLHTVNDQGKLLHLASCDFEQFLLLTNLHPTSYKLFSGSTKLSVKCEIKSVTQSTHNYVLLQVQFVISRIQTYPKLSVLQIYFFSLIAGLSAVPGAHSQLQ